ncbi:hypothetical protein NLZ15_02600 [Atlantibacter subterranea]|uniref:hypothetical protein n=1 Tax=Atlantibacter subterraneus TaxID=255519 RepID=UPI0020C2FFFE|nr:hypothetical protein [Atlantibacter subterranea]UTJ47978.1 hypothetical protein NLZ15_02600 [Atlantibacter subterranea]
MKNDFSFILRINKNSSPPSKIVIKQADDFYKKLREYCLTEVLEDSIASQSPNTDLQTMTERTKRLRREYIATRAGVSFDLSHKIVNSLKRIPTGDIIPPQRFQYLSELVHAQIARKERLLKTLVAQYQDVLVTARNAGKSPSSVRCSLLLNPNLILNSDYIDKATGQVKYIPGCKIFHNDSMIRYYLKRFKENIQQKALFKKHVMGYFWVKCHLKNQNSIYLHMNLYIDSKFEEINIINMVRDVWEKISTETKPGERQTSRMNNIPRKMANYYYSPEPGGILFYTKNKSIPLNMISNKTAHAVADTSGVKLATLSRTDQLI